MGAKNTRRFVTALVYLTNTIWIALRLVANPFMWTRFRPDALSGPTQVRLKRSKAFAVGTRSC
jgi:hypothetical protein